MNDEQNTRELRIPDLCLVVLIGPTGSGKTTFAARHFLDTEVLSSDRFRAMVADDENDQSATPEAFDALSYIAGKRLTAGRLTVVDATSVQARDRKQLIDLARAHDVLPVAIVLNVDERTCLERNQTRPERSFGSHVVRRQHQALRRSLKGLSREGFRRVHVLHGVHEVDAATVVREPLLTDRRVDHGPFDAIGDVHGCLTELRSLLTELGYRLRLDDQQQPVDAVHPDGRRVIFLGDLVDRGPDSAGVLRLAMGMVASGNALAVPGNHEAKLVKALRGQKVRVSHGLDGTLRELEAAGTDFREQVLEFCSGLVSHLVLDDGRLVVAHAGLKESYHNRSSGRVRAFALYGDTTGETDEFGLPVRYPWANDYRGKAIVLYGHTPKPTAKWVNNTICLDTGCVFGGKLTAMRYPELELVSAKAEKVYYEPLAMLDAPSDSESSSGSESSSDSELSNGSGSPDGSAVTHDAIRRPYADTIDIDDVLGKRVIRTAHLGSITIQAEQAAGALEVMSRFALEPASLPYLPPTMAPCATSELEDFLEHPAEAFAAYRSEGVTEVICQQKHMGSRAVLRLYADGRPGQVLSRTGRAFFDPDRTAELTNRLARAATAAGLWTELETDWLLLDAEIMPWSVKALDLVRDRFAAIGAAGSAAFPPALDALARAGERGLEVGELAARTRARSTNLEGFVAAYRRYCWPTDGLSGVEVAPFQVLASAGRTYHDRDHAWHLAIADRLRTQDPELVRHTDHRVLDLTDPEAVRAATDWWLELTASGGEGMVVKPLANLTRGKRGLTQPGVKCRGREYLRIIYGPDYTEPRNLQRLRKRSLGRKRSLAIREYALGLEALQRLVADEPLWRVHECVFGILALESDPVDPRL